MRKFKEKVQHIWSEDMEDALTAQYYAVRRQVKVLPPRAGNWRGWIRRVLVIGAVVALFVTWCAEVISSDGL